MSRRKLQKFKENDARANIIQPGKDLFHSIKGKWNDLYFKNDQPLILELGCGRGEYTIGMARLNQKANFVGVDIKGDRIWKGGKIAELERLTNVGFLRTQVQSLEDFFQEGEVHEIWLTFPDPRPKKSDIKRRLTHPRFIEIYRKLVAPEGTIHLKTDNELLFDYTLEVVQELIGAHTVVYTKDLYQSDLLTPELSIKTHYEVLFGEQGYKIKYLRFKLTTP